MGKLHRARGQIAAITITIAAALAAALPAGAAAAKIDGSAIESAEHVVGSSDSTGAPVGGYLSCPAGKRVLTGGAFWHTDGQSPDPLISPYVILSSSSPTLDGKGWYSDGSGGASHTLTQEVRCLDKDALQQAKVVVRSFDVPIEGVKAGQARCPDHYMTVTGGAYFARPGKGPDLKWAGYARVSGSLPFKDGRVWRAIGSNSTNKPLVLHVVARCMPVNRLGGRQFITRTEGVDSEETGGGYTSCKGPFRALTGGAAWKRSQQSAYGSAFALSTWLSGNAVTFDVLGQYTAGFNAGDSTLDLDTSLICIDL